MAHRATKRPTTCADSHHNTSYLPNSSRLPISARLCSSDKHFASDIHQPNVQKLKLALSGVQAAQLAPNKESVGLQRLDSRWRSTEYLRTRAT
eukprot:529246-Amphidinium_carterae.1